MRRAWAWLLAASLAACGTEPTPPSVVLITIDTLRADALGPQADGTSHTPHLDDLGARGLRFTHATSVTPLTLPTHASMLTGLRPGRHGLTVNGVTSPLFEAPALTSSLREAGYATAAFVSAAVLDRRYGLAQAFDVYDDDLLVAGGPLAPTERRGDRTVERARAWLANTDGPFFLWVHLFDPHAPYDAPGSSADASRHDRYLAEVRFADQQVGRLMESLAEHEDVLVIATADHGEGLGEHGEETHGLLLYESTMHVPLSWTWLRPKAGQASFAEPGRVRDELASAVDIAPTILDVVGLDVPPDLDGVSLAAPIASDRSAPLETRAPWFYYGASALAGARQGGDKVVGAVDAASPSFVLTDVADDPGELVQTPVDPDHPLVARVVSPAPLAEAELVASREMLAELGYISGEVRAVSDEPLRDPRDIVDLLAALDRANSAVVAGDPAGALEILDELSDTDAEVSEVLYLRGRAARAAGRPDEAVEALARAALAQPSSAGILLELARAWLATAEDASATARLARRRGGDLDRRAAYEASRAAAESMLALVPGDPDATAQWVLATWRGGDAELALAHLDDALTERPSHLGLWTVKLQLLASLGASHAERLSDARRAVRALAPHHPLLP